MTIILKKQDIMLSLWSRSKETTQSTPEEQCWNEIISPDFTGWAQTITTLKTPAVQNKIIKSYFSPYKAGCKRCRIGEDFELDFVVENFEATNDILDIYRMCNDIPCVELTHSAGWIPENSTWWNIFIIMCKMFHDMSVKNSTLQNFLHFNLDQTSTQESLWTIYQKICNNLKTPHVKQVSFAIIQDFALSQTLFCWSFIFVNEKEQLENQYRIMAVQDENSFKAFHVKDHGSVLQEADKVDKITEETFNQNFLHWATIAYQENKFGISLANRLAVYQKSQKKSDDLQLLSYNIEQDNKPLVAYIRDTCMNRHLKKVPDFDVYGVLYAITEKKKFLDAMQKDTDALRKSAIIHIVRKNNYDFIVKIVQSCETEKGKWTDIEVRTDIQALYWTSELLLPEKDEEHDHRSHFWEILSQMIHEDGTTPETSYMLDYLIESMLNMLFDEKLSNGIKGSIVRSNWKRDKESLQKNSADKTVRPYAFQNDNQQIFFFLKCTASQANAKTISTTHQSNILVVLKTLDDKKPMNKICILIDFLKTLENFYASAIDADFEVVRLQDDLLKKRTNIDVEGFKKQIENLNQVIKEKEQVMEKHETEYAKEKSLLHELEKKIAEQASTEIKIEEQTSTEIEIANAALSRKNAECQDLVKEKEKLVEEQKQASAEIEIANAALSLKEAECQDLVKEKEKLVKEKETLAQEILALTEEQNAEENGVWQKMKEKDALEQEILELNRQKTQVAAAARAAAASADFSSGL
jgi:hypothetical protein